MSLDPKQLEAFVNGPKPLRGDLDDMGSVGDTGEPQPQKKNFEPLKQLLTKFGDEVEMCLDEVDPETLEDLELDLEDSERTILEDGFNGLDRKFLRIAKPLLTGISQEEAATIGQELEETGLAEDGLRLGGWLFRLGQVFAPVAPEGDEFGDEDADLDSEDAESEFDDEASSGLTA
jgi:hypothetical protein